MRSVDKVAQAAKEGNMSLKNEKHEEFNIASTQRRKLVRQDRIETNGKDHFLRIGEEAFPVQNFSTFGIAVITKKQMPDAILGAVFRVMGYDIGELNLKKVREQTFDGETVTAFAVEGQPIDVEVALNVQEVNKTLTQHRQDALAIGEIDPFFRAKTLEFKEWLFKLESLINGLQKSSFLSDRFSVDLFEEVASQQVAKYLSEHLSPVYKQIEGHLSGKSEEEVRKCFTYFREQLGSCLYQSVYASRAYHKPRGYAGDYEMMNNVYRMEIRGDSLFAKCLQRYFVDEPAGRAVRNRAVYMKAKLKSLLGKRDTLKVLAVASGPAMEIQKLLTEDKELIAGKSLEIHLMDQDLESLKHAQRCVEEVVRKNALANVKTHYHNLAIKNVITDGFPGDGFDFIYSSGLFDYLSAPVAQMAATRLMQATKENGEVIIGNFSLDNPNEFPMGMIMDWHLIYRSTSDLEKLFKPVCRSVVVEKEELGINLFAVLKR